MRLDTLRIGLIIIYTLLINNKLFILKKYAHKWISSSEYWARSTAISQGLSPTLLTYSISGIYAIDAEKQFKNHVKYKEINTWCCSMYKAADDSDETSVEIFLKKVLTIDYENNPLLLALSEYDEYAVEKIVRVMRYIWPNHKNTISTVLTLSTCPLIPVMPSDQILNDFIQCMIQRGADVNERGPDRLPAIHASTLRNSMWQVQALVNLGVDVNSRDSSGNTPLHTATLSQNGYEIAEFLIANGAEVNPCNMHGHRPLYYAHFFRQEDERLTLLLLQNGALLKPEIHCVQAETHIVANRSLRHAIEHFLDCELNVYEKDPDGNTILHLAMRRNKEFLINELLDRGLDIHCKNNVGVTPLRMYLGRMLNISDMSVWQFYFDHGGDLNVLLEWSVLVHVNLLFYHSLLHTTMYRNVILQQIAISTELGDRTGVTLYSNIHINALWRVESLLYLHECHQELTAMKATKFYEDITYFDILTCNTKQLTSYARNESLIEAFENSIHTFFIYSRNLRNRFYKVIEKERLIKMTAVTLRRALGFILPLDVIQYYILSYYTEYDMLKFNEIL